MLIAQITDFHVVAEGQLCYGRVPTNDQLREAVAHLNALRPRPDVVVASGDLVDHGAPEEYAALRGILAGLEFPFYLIPGNHDDREALLEAFSDQAYLPAPGAEFVQWVVEDHPVRILGLDTSVPGHHYGLLCEKRLAWLDETLSQAPDEPTIVFMHHPPFRTGIRWMDSSGLTGGRAMQAIVSRHRQVQRVACGHIHRPIQLGWAGTVVSVAPSTCHQVALNLRDHGAFEFVMEPRAVQLHQLDPAYGIVSHTSYVGQEAQPFLPYGQLSELTPQQVEALVERGLARLRETEFDV